jgi:prevent-host-death family protein|tara:strand:+ start:85 stop:321 length:237 start_codon:yes stop_codon:yes gene_type:complete
MLYTTHQAKTHLSRLLDEAASGGEVIIAKGKRRVARLVPCSGKKQRPRPKVGETTSKPFNIVEKRKAEGSDGDTVLYF